MAGKPAPSSYEPTCQWNQGPVTLIYQWKKIKGVMGVKNDPQAKQREWPPGNAVLSTSC